MNILQQAKYDSLLANIKLLMLENGISNLKISDIAKAVQVGEATIYRYFGNRTNLVIEVGISVWKDIYNELNKLKSQETGYKSLEYFFGFFKKGYQENKEVFIFLNEFDSLMVKENVSEDKLKVYDNELFRVKDLYDGFFKQGLNDKSIKNSIDKDEYYYTTTHMILGICKRLSTIGNMVPSDSIVKDTIQIEMALNMCLQFIREERGN